jgi:hypothetical protein
MKGGGWCWVAHSCSDVIQSRAVWFNQTDAGSSIRLEWMIQADFTLLAPNEEWEPQSRATERLIFVSNPFHF